MAEQLHQRMLEDNPEGEHPHHSDDEHSVGAKDGDEAEDLIPDDENEGLIFMPEYNIVSEEDSFVESDVDTYDESDEGTHAPMEEQVIVADIDDDAAHAKKINKQRLEEKTMGQVWKNYKWILQERDMKKKKV